LQPSKTTDTDAVKNEPEVSESSNFQAFDELIQKRIAEAKL